MNRNSYLSITYSVLGGLIFWMGFVFVYGSEHIAESNFAVNWNVITLVTLLVIAIIRMAPIPDVVAPANKSDKFRVQSSRILFIVIGTAFAELAIRWIDQSHFFVGAIWTILSVISLYCAPQLILKTQIENAPLAEA